MKQLSSASQPKFQEWKNSEYTKGKNYEVNASKINNINKIIIDQDSRSDDSCIASKFHHLRDLHQSLVSLKGMMVSRPLKWALNLKLGIIID